MRRHMRHNGPMTDMIALENDFWQVGLVPATGGSVAYTRAQVAGSWLEVLRPTPDDALDQVWETASFPLVPWSNRFFEGRFTWRDEDYQLRVNFKDGTAIHGTALEFPWRVTEATPTSAWFEFRSADFYGVNYPWAFSSKLGYELDGERFVWTMEITNDTDEPFPAGLGHHPFFLRELVDGQGNVVGGPAQLQLNCTRYYPGKGCIPFAGAEDLEPRVDFRQLRPLGEEFVDDCFTGRTSSIIATVEYPGALTLDMEAGALLEHAVVYIPQGLPIWALEAVTNANDGINLESRGIPGAGVFVLQPGETRSTSFTLVAQPQA